MNPYKVLGIDRSAGKREILQAAALALRERKYPAREIAEAQKELMNPTTKSVSDFVHFIDVKPFLSPINLARPEPETAPELTYLNLFDEKP